MNPAWRLRALAILVVTIVAAGAGCTSGGPTTPALPVPVDPVVWVVLGGDATVDDRRTIALSDTWPQLVFRDHLPAEAVHVNLGKPGADIADVERDQVDAAIDLAADVVAVWIGDVDATLSADLLSGVLTSVLARLADADIHVVIVLGGGRTSEIRTVVDAVAVPVGIPVVELTPPDLATTDGHRMIAEQLGPTLGRAASSSTGDSAQGSR